MARRISWGIFAIVMSVLGLACSADDDDPADDEVVGTDDQAVSTGGCQARARGTYCGSHYMLYGKGNPNTLYRCTNGKRTVAQRCKSACYFAPYGYPDQCV